ncbi:tetratricopeptide repeat protein [Glycomyces sp. NPDC047369]
MLFELIGQTWAYLVGPGTGDEDSALSVLIAEAEEASDIQLARMVEALEADRIERYADALIHHGQAKMRLGSREGRTIGRILIALDYTGGIPAATGHLLTALASPPLSPECARQFEQARLMFEDAGARPQRCLAAIGSLAAGHRWLERDDLGPRLTALHRELLTQDVSAAGLIAPGIDHHRRTADIARRMVSRRELPSTFPRLTGADDDWLLQLAMVRVAAAQPDSAAALARGLDEELRLQGVPAVYCGILTGLFVQAREWDSALPLLREQYESDGRSAAAAIELSRALAATGDWSAAKVLLLAHLGDPPAEDDVVVLQRLVLEGHSTRDPDMASWIAALRGLGADVPTETLVPKSMAQKADVRRPILLARFENGRLTIDPSLPPGDIEAHMTAAIVLGSPERGAELMQDIAEKNPALHAEVLRLMPSKESDDARAHFERAEAAFNQRRFNDAIAEYKAAIELDPNFTIAYLYLGDAYYNLGDYHLAAAYFTESIAIEPTAQALRFLGDAFQRCGRDLGVIRQCYEHALRLDPGYGGARIALDQLLGRS